MNANIELNQLNEEKNNLAQMCTKKLKDCFELEKKVKLLSNRIEELQLMLCDKSCVERVLNWICKHEKFDVVQDNCGCQLGKILVRRAGASVTIEDLKCEQFMNILLKNKIVEKFDEYHYPEDFYRKLKEIDNIWKLLTTLDGKRVIILGRIMSREKDLGHAEGFDLTSWRWDEEGTLRVTIFDPFNSQSGNNADQQYFRSHLVGDEGLVLYDVKLNQINKIIKDEYKLILHNRTFSPTDGIEGGNVPCQN